ncbi:predicted protein [Nematostella vectensis]|uniref:Cadherin domain-containing protein n=1 Tax=Nematostella vectensis TaxID=45351 RepID=A7SYG7_NEMVE|nr:predicted protein [Nematostella vectensis]|eukprot:XP_001623350.1 predicted protein [Nematostella vectensis]
MPDESCAFAITGPVGVPFSLGADGLSVLVDGQLDHEMTPLINVVIRATDSGGLSKEMTLTVTLFDVNENPTLIMLSKKEVPENSEIGTFVGTLSCKDPEMPDDSCTFKILGPSGAPFTLGADGTSLLVNGPLDHERDPLTDVVVRATDRGGLYKDMTLSVTISDINEPPTLIELSKNIIEENSPPGTLIGTLSCLDPEQPEDSCSFTLMGPSDVPFLIMTQGSVFVDGHLDFEMKLLYDIVVRATDTRGLYKEMTLTIIISGASIDYSFNLKRTVRLVSRLFDDVNEAPTLIAISNSVVKENSPVGTFVGTLTCEDPEMPDDLCTFKVMGPRGVPFDIGAEEMNLFVSAPVDFETKHSFNVVVRATDRGGLFKEMTISVHLSGCPSNSG